MKKITRSLVTGMILLFLCYHSNAQLRFDTASTWLQVLAKARTEHKGIFVDCYASWCGPCKWMEANIYPVKEVGDVYNRNFICIDVQMDKTIGDSKTVKAKYEMAGMLGRNYHIDAYPTYLFFDENARPLHKATGSMGANAFITLATDAGNPAKQYYTLLKNFRPGVLDTAEEKALSYGLRYTDRALSGKLAIDYLSRLSVQQLNLSESKQYMADFQNDSLVLAFAIRYINAHPKGQNMALLAALGRHVEIRQIAMAYIKSLDDEHLSVEKNQKLMQHFSGEAVVQQVAIDYINRLPEDSLYLTKNIKMMTVFTKTPTDRGFGVFYHHADKINRVMQYSDYAQTQVVSILVKTEFGPAITSAKQSGKIPAFDSLKAVLARRYDTVTASRVVHSGKVDWYKYLAWDQKQTQYFPELIDEEIADIDANHADTLSGARMGINNLCYAFIFLHGTQKQLERPIRWMAEITEKYSYDPSYMDTYACLLYKAGKKEESIVAETKALTAAENANDAKQAWQFRQTIKHMKNGEQIWLEKEYQVPGH